MVWGGVGFLVNIGRPQLCTISPPPPEWRFQQCCYNILLLWHTFHTNYSPFAPFLPMTCGWNFWSTLISAKAMDAFYKQRQHCFYFYFHNPQRLQPSHGYIVLLYYCCSKNAHKLKWQFCKILAIKQLQYHFFAWETKHGVSLIVFLFMAQSLTLWFALLTQYTPNTTYYMVNACGMHALCTLGRYAKCLVKGKK